MERSPDHHQHEQQGQNSQTQLTPQQTPDRQLLHGLPPPPPAGQPDAQREYGQHGPRQQVAHLTHIGLQGVGHHGGIDHDTIGLHEITVSRYHQQQYHARWFTPAGPHQQAQQHGRRRQHDQHHRHQAKPGAQAVVVRQSPQRPPKGQVAQGRQPQGQHQQKTQGVPRAANHRISRGNIGSLEGHGQQ